MSPTIASSSLQRDGTSQEDRQLHTLNPVTVKIDDRQIEDLLYYAWQHAAELNFYSQNSVPDGNWQDFLHVEPAIALAVINKQSSSRRDKEFLIKHRALAEIGDADLAIDHKNPRDWQRDLQVLFDNLASYLYDIKDWMGLLREDRDSKLMLKGFAKSHICPLMEEVISLYRGFFDIATDPFIKKLQKTLTDFAYVRFEETAPDNIIFSIATVSEKIYAVRDPLLRLKKMLDRTRAQIQRQALQRMHRALARPAAKKPHIGLFLSFIELFQRSQENLNKLSEKHLDFYYKKVLQIKARQARVDKLNVLIKTKAGLRKMIPAGTPFNAGKDDEGNDLFYALTDNFYPNSALVAEIKNLHLEHNPDGSQSIHCAEIANSADGQGAELPADASHWSAFGDTSQKLADVGFAVSSPILRLAEGQRRIRLSLAVDDFHEEGWQLFFQRYASLETQLDLSNWIVDFSQFLSFQFSGQEYWLDIEPLSVEIQCREKSVYLVVEFDLLPEHPAIVDYNREVLAGNYLTPWPIMCCKLVYFQNSFPYDIFKNIKFKSCRLDVDVEGLTNLIIQSNDQRQKLLEPFSPFGNFPQLGASLYIGSREVFAKKVDKLKINWLWQNAPRSFADHYKSYVEATGEKAEFKVDCSYLDNGQWQPVQEQVPLMESRKVHVNYYGDWKIQDPESSFIEFENLNNSFSEIDSFAEYDFQAARGFIKLQLASPGYAFGHKLYPKLHAIETRQRAMEEAQRIYSEQLRESREELEHSTIIGRIYDKLFAKHQPPSSAAPQEEIHFDSEGNIVEGKLKKPYDPVWHSLSLDYSSSVELHINADSPAEPIQFMHLQPFGFEPIALDKLKTSQPLLPQFNSEGYLYIGLEGIKAPQNITLLFQVLENSENPYIHKPSKVQYSYMSSSGWKSLEEHNRLIDASLGLLQSGILSFELPGDAVDNSTWLPQGKYWLRISQNKGIQATPRLLGIHTQAAELTFVDHHNSLSHLQQPLPPQSISSIVGDSRQIDAIVQPYPSFGGRPQEKETDYRKRVSERLRHKGQALTLWDYEHLALEFFPGLCKTKCLNHTTDELETKNGHTCLVVVPDTGNPNAFDRYRPAVSQAVLQQIENFFKPRTSPFVKLSVINPVYEKLQLQISVVFREGYDRKYSLKTLNEDLCRFISPWAFNSGQPHIGAQLHKAAIIKFIEDRPYVDFIDIDHLLMRHTINGVEAEYTDTVTASTAASVLYSARQHIIQVDTGEDHP